MAQDKPAVFDELDKLKKKYQESYAPKPTNKKSYRFSKLELYKIKVTLAEVTKSKLRLAFVPRGSELIKIKTNEAFYTTEDINVMAYSKPDHQNYRYVVDKKNNLKYKVQLRFLTPVKDVTTLYEPPSKFIRLKKKVSKKKFDTRPLSFYLGAKLQTALTTTGFTRTIVKNTTSLAPAIRVEINTLINTQGRLKPALALQYETIKGSNFETQTISLGPEIKLNDLFRKFNLAIQTRLSLFSDLNDLSREEARTITLTETSFLVGLEKKYKYFTLGYSLQQKWISASTKGSGINFNLSNQTDSSFGIYISRGVNL